MGLNPAIDISTDQRKTILELLGRYLPNTTAWVYGSRVKWTSRPQSDLDMVVFATPEQHHKVSDLREAFEESNLPFRVDLFVWDEVPEQFCKEIEVEHVVLVEKEAIGIRNEWPEVPISKVASVVIGGTPVRSVAEYWGGNIPWATAKDIAAVSSRYLEQVQECITEQGLKSSAAKLMPKGTVVITARGTVGALVQLRREMAFNQTCYAIFPNDVLNGDYLFYALKGTLSEMRSLTYGTVFETITRRTFDNWQIPLPSLPEQRAIAQVLGTLDDKIELNRRMNEMLENMAQALFKSWFVDFEPIRAKMEGRDTGLPLDVAALFPDRLVDSELGKIPEGWEVGVLDDSIELHSGGTPKTSISDYWRGDIPWYTPKDAPNLNDVFVLETERSITQEGVKNSAAKILPAGTTIITARGTVGRLACLGRPMAMNQTCYGIQGAQGYSDFFTYWSIRKAVDELQNRTHGTVFDTITRQTFKIVDMVFPSVDVTEVFESTVNPIMERILKNLHESLALAAQRDTLLPTLVSGELRINFWNEEFEATGKRR